MTKGYVYLVLRSLEYMCHAITGDANVGCYTSALSMCSVTLHIVTPAALLMLHIVTPAVQLMLQQFAIIPAGSTLHTHAPQQWGTCC